MKLYKKIKFTEIKGKTIPEVLAKFKIVKRYGLSFSMASGWSFSGGRYSYSGYITGITNEETILVYNIEKNRKNHTVILRYYEISINLIKEMGLEVIQENRYFTIKESKK